MISSSYAILTWEKIAVAEMAKLGRRPRLKILYPEWGVRVRIPFSVQKSYEFCRAYIGRIEEFEEYFKIVQEKFNEIPSDQEIASQECKQSQIKNQVIETLEKVILDIKTLK